MTPGYAGGSNWGGVAVDAAAGIVVANVNELPTLVHLVPRDEFDRSDWDGWDGAGMAGTPYVMLRRLFLSGIGLPCVRPPWGKLIALDLKSRSILWEIPLGTIADLAPFFVPNMAWGVPTWAAASLPTAT